SEADRTVFDPQRRFALREFPARAWVPRRVGVSRPRRSSVARQHAAVERRQLDRSHGVDESVDVVVVAEDPTMLGADEAEPGRLVEQGDELVVVAVGVEEADRFVVILELGPGGDLEALLERAAAAGKGDAP